MARVKKKRDDFHVQLLARMKLRLDELGLSEREAGELLGKLEPGGEGKPDGFRNVRRGSYPNVARLRHMARVLECSCAYLMGEAEEPGHPAVVGNSPVVTFSGEKYGAIPRYDILASAGPGEDLPATPPIRDRVLFRMEWLQRATSATIEQLAALDVVGDSMAPTLDAGDTVLMDLSQTDPLAREGIYVMNDDGRLRVKRLEAASDGVAVISDNRAYPALQRARDEIDVVGRVIWMGRQL